jgi:hypothetical protein
LRPQLNQIRTWVRQGRTDAWIAHQLEVTVQEIEEFKRQNELAGGRGPLSEGGESPGVPFPEEIDLRAEDDALIAAELEAAEAERESEVEHATDDGGDDGEPSGEGAREGRRRRGRRGGRGRSRAARALEGTFDHGEEGYGLWLDPAITDDPVYAEHWAGHRPVTVVVEPDQIVIRRSDE